MSHGPRAFTAAGRGVPCALLEQSREQRELTLPAPGLHAMQPSIKRAIRAEPCVPPWPAPRPQVCARLPHRAGLACGYACRRRCPWARKRCSCGVARPRLDAPRFAAGAPPPRPARRLWRQPGARTRRSTSFPAGTTRWACGVCVCARGEGVGGGKGGVRALQGCVPACSCRGTSARRVSTPPSGQACMARPHDWAASSAACSSRPQQPALRARLPQVLLTVGVADTLTDNMINWIKDHAAAPWAPAPPAATGTGGAAGSGADAGAAAKM